MIPIRSLAPTARLSAILAAPALALGVLSAQAGPGPAKPGAEIYRQKCVSCHGAKGEGSKAYRKPLTGTRSVGELARFIQQSMPPGAARRLSAADARSVAAHIHAAFYSPLAQARSRPARVELSRLTVRQYRNTLTDLIGSFRPPAPLDDRRGLHGTYFKTGRLRGGEKVLERIDPEIRFDFGTTGPLKEQDDPYQFAMRWEGALLAPDTGEYEFVVRTDQAARLWINDLRRPVVDAYVKSGSDNVYRGTLYLLGGRAYPLRLEFGKGVQGVDDLSKLKKKPPQPASISLEWRRPKLAEEVIPQRCLMPVMTPEVYVCSTPFPPDDRSAGYERASSVSREWDSAATEAALDAAAYVAERLPELSGAREDAADRADRVRAFCAQFVERAFRRPVPGSVARLYVDTQFQDAKDLETAVRRVVMLALKSPRFLYREAGLARDDPYAVASRLSYALWDSLPDAELLKAAATGALAAPDTAREHARRMTADPRARSKLRDFFLQWLKVDHFPDLAKDQKRYPGFDDHAATDLRTSLEILLDEIIAGEKADFRDLLLADRIHLNGRLAKLYGVNLPESAGFQPVALDPAERAGVLTHPYVLASFAYLDASSPIHRGVLVARSLLGRTLLPPPVAVAPAPASLHPGLTTRQGVALQTRPPACMSCHDLINPLGFTLERFDAIGRLRQADNGKPVDSSGSYKSRSGRVVRFSGVRDLARFLAQSDESHGAFVEKLFQYLIKQPVQAYGPETLGHLQRAFAQGQYSIRQQTVETAVAAALPPLSARTARGVAE